MKGLGGFGGERVLAFYVGEGDCPRLQTLMKRKCLGDFATLACIQPILHTGGKVSRESFGLIQKGRVRWVGGREPTNHLFDAPDKL